MQHPRIFLLGDSFTANSFREWTKNISEGEKSKHIDVGYYVNEVLSAKLPPPLHFEDYLNLAGYETVNLGGNGCTNDNIFQSFTGIDPNYRSGDRIIINWTGLNRFNWIQENGEIASINGWMPNDYDTNPKSQVIYDQYLARMESSKPGGKLLEKSGSFMNYLLRKNEEYRPLMWIPGDFPNDFFREQRFFIPDPSHELFNPHIRERKKLTIEQEIGIPDRHYGRWGQYYLGIIFLTALEYTQERNSDGYWIKDEGLISLIQERIGDAKPDLQDVPGYYLQKLKKLI